MSLEKIPSISVLMPVYNAEHYLPMAVESILNQSFKDFEFIIINDGSTDNSLNILEHYANQDNRIHLISRENKGLVATLNEGIGYAKAPLIARMDADDISLPERLQKQYSHMIKHSDCVACGTAFQYLLPDGEKGPVFSVPTDHRSIDGSFMRKVDSFGMLHPSTIMKKESLIKINGYREEFIHAEDNDLFLRLAEVGDLNNISEVLFYYRLHPVNVKFTNKLIQKKSGERGILQACERRGIDKKYYLELFSKEVPPPDSGSNPYITIGWMSIKVGNRTASLKYAFRAFVLQPCNKESLRLLFCALRGR
ncbi:MAG: glycosyltransferase [Desulfobulbaceae bacterium]|nr:glycosyltransferase [Desulfobulbaceae bacterium]